MTLSAMASSDSALAPAYAAAQRICRREARGFYGAGFFLPPARRNAAYAAGALCRMIVEAMAVPAGSVRGASAMRAHPAVAAPRTLPVIQPHHDDHCDIDTPEARLAMLRDRLDEIYRGQLELPSVEARSEQQHALYAFAETVRRHEIPRQWFLDLAEACRMDAALTSYATWDELQRYCYHSGGRVALILGGVLGLTHSDARTPIMTLGSAMRLTSILRDVKPDWNRGRVYLPQEDMERFGYPRDALARGVVDERFGGLMRFQIERARRLYRDGAGGICWLAGDGSRLAAATAAVFHAGILDAIERRQCDVFSRPVDLATPQRLLRLPRAWRLARRQHDQPLPDVF